MTTEFDRRRLLQAGGSISLGALVAACGEGEAPTAGPTATSTTTLPPATTPPPSTPPPPTPPTPSAVDLLSGRSPCVLTAETIAGPTWFDAQAVRSDIRQDRAGMPLDLAFRVVALPDCTPVAGAVVDLWQCDAAGIYSGFADAGPGQGGDPAGSDEYGDDESAVTDPATWLRGTQVTGVDGIVRFATVYPGWYPTRSLHLHLKVHQSAGTVLTTQLFFDDDASDAVLATEPYAAHPGRQVRNDTDPFYDDTALLTMASPAGDGWLAAITLGIE